MLVKQTLCAKVSLIVVVLFLPLQSNALANSLANDMESSLTAVPASATGNCANSSILSLIQKNQEAVTDEDWVALSLAYDDGELMGRCYLAYSATSAVYLLLKSGFYAWATMGDFMRSIADSREEGTNPIDDPSYTDGLKYGHIATEALEQYVDQTGCDMTTVDVFNLLKALLTTANNLQGKHSPYHAAKECNDVTTAHGDIGMPR